MSPIITLDNICASYDGKSVLEHVSLQILSLIHISEPTRPY